MFKDDHALAPVDSGPADWGWSGRVPDLHHLPPFVNHQQITNHLSFQQHSGFERLSCFVFIYIQASLAGFPQRSFVFRDIPASFRQLEMVLFLLPPQRATSCLSYGEPIRGLFVPLGAFSEVGWGGQKHCSIVFLAGRDLQHSPNILF